MKKALLVYYSRTGTTEALAKKIQTGLGCDLEEIIDLKSRDGFWGNFRGGIDALFQRETAIGPLRHDPTAYDLILVGSPVWYGNLAPAVRTWLTRHLKGEPGFDTAFFCTFAGKGNLRAEKKFRNLTQTDTTALLCVQNGESDERVADKLTAFTEALVSSNTN